MQERRVKLATTECKTHWSNVDTRSYIALDFTLHDSHMLITIIFKVVLEYIAYSFTISIVVRG